MNEIEGFEIFDSGDAPFLKWMQSNPDGFVLNTELSPNSRYAMLHRSKCHHISGYTKLFSQGAFTEHGYIKICSNESSVLESWLEEFRPRAEKLEQCHTCNPDVISQKETGKKTTGYWTFFCNPARWQIDKFLSSGHQDDAYQITKWQQEEFAPGQLGVIRVGVDHRNRQQLEGRPKLHPGIYGIVEVRSFAEKRVDAPDEFWLDWSPDIQEKPIVQLHYMKNLLANPILLSELKQDPVIDDPYVVRGFQASSMPLTSQSFLRICEFAGDFEYSLESGVLDTDPTTNEQILQLEQEYSRAVPEVKEVLSKQIERGPFAAKIKELSGGKCQICEALGLDPYSFRKMDGEYYVEVHHIIPVSERQPGSLGLSNLMTVCANHHRQLHYGNVKIIANTGEELIFDMDEKELIIHKNKFS